jgi:aspartate/methionine/tyrosine aminotransferase
MFSHRVPADLSPTRYAAALADMQARAIPIVDLTAANPTIAGFEYPESLLAPLADPAALRYDPHPFGGTRARGAVSSDYARRGHHVMADQVVLTASTSEAYSLLFKLLCDPGDEVLVPVPSYPLFDHLTRLDGVRTVSYPLDYHGRWSIDLDALERAVSPGAKAVLVVSPNNPTGTFISHGELNAVSALCARHGLALIGDEVFADYTFDGRSTGPSVIDQRQALAFSLGGLSKSAGLPQLKLGWIAMAGPAESVEETTTRLELICDTYLSVGTPVQHAAPRLIEGGAAVREQVSARVRTNHDALRTRLRATPEIELLDADGGWYAVLRVPATIGEERLALELLLHDRVLVHPGYFFDFPHEAFLVVSLLPAPEEFADGLSRVIGRALHSC